jgi:hypothetical protein
LRTYRKTRAATHTTYIERVVSADRATAIVSDTGVRKIMTAGKSRSILRWIHIVFAIPIAGYVYSPFENIPDYAAPTRFVFFPVLVLTGLWMWKGHVVRRLFLKGSPRASNA